MKEMKVNKSMKRSLYSSPVVASLMAVTLLSAPMIVRGDSPELPSPGAPYCSEFLPDEALGLGTAAKCAVLQLGNAKVSIGGSVEIFDDFLIPGQPPGSIRGAFGIFGDVCIGPRGKFSLSGEQFVTGTVKLSPGATFANSRHGSVRVLDDVDLSVEIRDAYAAALAAALLDCDQSFAKLDGKTVTTIVGVAGLNVVCVQDVVLSGGQILLTGEPGAQFIINVTGKFVLAEGSAGPQIRVDGFNVQPKDVLYNIIGKGPDVACSSGAIVNGTLLAPLRKIALGSAKVNGAIISGKDIKIHSGGGVGCGR